MLLGNIFVQYRNTNTIFGSDRWRSKTLVISLDFDMYYDLFHNITITLLP